MTRRSLAPVLVALALAGCGTAAAPNLAPIAAPAVAPAAPVAAPAVSTGRLEISVAGLGGGYTVQATVAQVKYLRVTLSGGPLTTPVTKSVSTAALANGKGTVAFEALPAGTLSVKIDALDGAGLNLGTKTASAVVTPGQTAVVAAALKLNATHVTAGAGNLEFDLTLQDGDIVTDKIATASARPDSPTLKPVPSPLPTIAPELLMVGDPVETWNGNGTLTVEGTFKNQFSTTERVTVSATFSARGLLFGGLKPVETLTQTFEVVPSMATRKFSLTSTKKVTSWRGDGVVEVKLIRGS